MLRPLLGSRPSSVLLNRLSSAAVHGAQRFGTGRGQFAPQRAEPPTSLINRLSLFGTPVHARALHVLPTNNGWPLSSVLNEARSSPPATALLTQPGYVRAFHSTPPCKGWPAIPLLLGFLKTSNAIQLAGTVSRIALTFLPMALVHRMNSSKRLQKIDAKIAKGNGNEELHKRREVVTERFRNSTRFFYLIVFTPILLFWLTIVSSMERTPLTGRWRLILLSPDEEEDIAAQLAGSGWYRAVGEILMQNAPTRLIDANDWRYQWVLSTLRRLESVIPILSYEEHYRPDWMECGSDDIPQPPPAKYPLRPRPRASEYFRQFAEAARHRTAQTPAHSIPGPPYSLLVVDDPASSNAFSYGFGPDGGGGVVVFSGFIDDVLRKHPHASIKEPQPISWWKHIVGGLFGLTPHGPTRPVPTAEQTEELAVLLAHELAHLVLTHHIETLSTGTIIWPGVITLCTDLVRSFLFPLTMLFGPFINDALAALGKASSGEISHITEFYTSQSQEIEADIVSARYVPAPAPARLDLNAALRLLAHAGFDPRHAVQFWEGRAATPQTAECTPGHAEEVRCEEESDTVLMVLPRRWVSSSHPLNTVRVQTLRQELVRWEEARLLARERREKEKRAARDEDKG